MDKQRDGFEAWLIEEFKLKKHDYALHFVDGEYQCTPTQARWLAWQQAQKVAVPEGFVLIEKKILLEGVNKIEQLFEDDPLLALGELLPIQQGLKAMIEVGEKK